MEHVGESCMRTFGGKTERDNLKKQTHGWENNIEQIFNK